jgi:multiple sugar transport system ATP-binding protein
MAGDLSFERAGVADGEVVVGVRPESVRTSADGMPTLEFEVDVVEPLGDEVLVYGTVAGEAVEVEQAGAEEKLPPLPGARALLTVRLDPSKRPAPGTRMTLGVPADAVHLFDGVSGAALD